MKVSKMFCPYCQEYHQYEIIQIDCYPYYKCLNCDKCFEHIKDFQ